LARALPFPPRVSLAHARFSGDDPQPALERCRSRTYAAMVASTVLFGLIGRTMFLNTNLGSGGEPRPRPVAGDDPQGAWPAPFEADELNSPLQIRQCGSTPPAATTRFQRGVTSRPQGQEVLASYTRVLTANLARTATASVVHAGQRSRRTRRTRPASCMRRQCCNSPSGADVAET
jgi:hypothetical protein